MELVSLHSSTIEVLKKDFSKGKIAHSYIFSGRDGIGKKDVALFFARASLCQSNDFYCGRCHSCTVKNHPDIIFVDREEGSERIKAEDVREIILLTHISPFLSQKRFIIINYSHLLSKQAFSALLKTIEEPSSQTVFILITSKIHNIPSTLISRSRIIRLSIRKDDFVRFILEKIDFSDEEYANLLWLLTAGSISYAMELDKLGIREMTKSVSALFDEPQSIVDFVLKIADTKKSPQEQRDMARLILNISESMLVSTLGTESDILKSFIPEKLIRLPEKKKVEIWERIQNSKRKIEAFANIPLSIASEFLQI